MEDEKNIEITPVERMPINQKYMITIREAAMYYSIGIKKMRRIAEANTDKFAIYAGNRFLIIRHLFEQHLVESLGKGESDLI